MASSEASTRREDNPLLAPLRALVHHGRVVGYAPYALLLLWRKPRATLQTLGAYYTLRFGSPTWRKMVRGMLSYGSSRRPQLVRAQTRPYDSSKQYLLCAHPHGILNGGWWNLFCRYGLHLHLDQPPLHRRWQHAQ